MSNVTKQMIERRKTRPLEQQNARRADQAWEKSISKSEGKLSKLADKIRADIKAGRTKSIDPDSL